MAAVVERDQTGKREDLRDAITYADRKKSKFMTRIKKGTQPSNTLMEWMVDNYPEPRSEGTVDEADVTNFENFAAGRVPLNNRLQIFERKPKVSRLANKVSDVAGVGRRKEMAKSIAKSIVMVKRDMEFHVLSDLEAVVDDGNAGNKTRALGKWIQSTAQAIYPVPDDYRPAAAQIDTTAIASIADDTIIGVMQAIYDVTGDDEADLVGWCGSTFKRAVSKLTLYQPTVANFDSVRRFTQMGDGKKITQSVDVLETDFGTLKLVLAAFINTGGTEGAHKSAASKRLCYVTPMEMLEWRASENPNYRALEDAGGGPRGLTESIGGLVCLNPKPFGAFRPSA